MLYRYNIYKFCTINIRSRLISSSLLYVPRYGWDQRAIHAGCVALDLSPASHKIIIPYDMISTCMQKWNEQSLEEINLSQHTRIRQKISHAIKHRLMKEISYIDTWHQAMAIGAHPNNITHTKNNLWKYSDQIWRRCGDRSTDYNYYTKRILFNTAYATTELFMLTDKSSEYKASWQFLQRRLDDIEYLGKNIHDLKTMTQATKDGVLSVLSMFNTPKQYNNPIVNYKEQKEESLQNNLSVNSQSQDIKNKQRNQEEKSSNTVEQKKQAISNQSIPFEKINK